MRNPFYIYVLLLWCLATSCGISKLQQTAWKLEYVQQTPLVLGVKTLEYKRPERNSRLGIAPYLDVKEIRLLSGQAQCLWNNGCNYYEAKLRLNSLFHHVVVDTSSVNPSLIDCYDTTQVMQDSIGYAYLLRSSKYKIQSEKKYRKDSLARHYKPLLKGKSKSERSQIHLQWDSAAAALRKDTILQHKPKRLLFYTRLPRTFRKTLGFRNVPLLVYERKKEIKIK
jgi:hypothetical protein